MSYRLAGFLGGFGAVLLLGSLPWSLDLTGAFAAVGLADVVLGVVGLAVSTLTAIAGALVLADMWADFRCCSGLAADLYRAHPARRTG